MTTDDRNNLFSCSSRSQSLEELGIVVVIPTFNEERAILAVLQQLVSDKTDLPNLAIVVADGGSTDNTVVLAEEQRRTFPFISIVHNPDKLQSAAVNMVARQWHGKADILIRCDAHAAYPQHFIRDLVSALIETDADSVVVPMDSVGRDCVSRAVAWVSDTTLGSGGSAHRGGKRSGFVDHGHHAAFKLDRFLQNDGYDESFSHNEDAEFDCRLNAQGGRVFLAADIRLKYYPRDTLARLWKQYFNYGKGRSRTVRRHPSTMRLRQVVVPVHFILTLASLFWTLVTGYRLFLFWPVFYGLALAAVSLLIAVTRKSACGLLTGPAAAVMHFAWASGFFWGLITIKEPRWKPA